ncbi:MAG: phage integrase SAM-like domain-containing protein, partial [Anaerolineae bacterium]
MKLSSLSNCAASAAGHNPISADTRRIFDFVARQLIKSFGDIPITAVTPEMLTQWQSHLYGRPNLKIITANSYTRTLRTMLNRLGYHDLTAALHFRPEPPPPAKTVTEEDYAAMLAVASVRDAAILLLLAES